MTPRPAKLPVLPVCMLILVCCLWSDDKCSAIESGTNQNIKTPTQIAKSVRQNLRQEAYCDSDKKYDSQVKMLLEQPSFGLQTRPRFVVPSSHSKSEAPEPYIALAEKYRDKNRYESAICYLKAAAVSPIGQAEPLIETAMVLSKHLDQYQLNGVADALNELAQISAHSSVRTIGTTKSACEICFKNALALESHSTPKRIRLATLNGMRANLRRDKQASEDAEIARQIIDVEKESGPSDDKEITAEYRRLENDYVARKDIKSARAVAFESLSFLERQGGKQNINLIQDLCVLQVASLEENGQAKSSHQPVQRIVAIIDDYHFVPRIATNFSRDELALTERSLATLCNAYAYSSDKELRRSKTAESLEKARYRFRLLNDSSAWTNALVDLCNFLESASKNEESAVLYKDAADYLETHADKWPGSIDIAALRRRSVAAFTAAGKTAEASALSAEIDAMQEKKSQAERKVTEQNLAELEKSHSSDSISFVKLRLKLATSYCAEKNYQKAAELFQSALRELEKAPAGFLVDRFGNDLNAVTRSMCEQQNAEVIKSIVHAFELAEEKSQNGVPYNMVPTLSLDCRDESGVPIQKVILSFIVKSREKTQKGDRDSFKLIVERLAVLEETLNNRAEATALRTRLAEWNKKEIAETAAETSIEAAIVTNLLLATESVKAGDDAGANKNYQLAMRAIPKVPMTKVVDSKLALSLSQLAQAFADKKQMANADELQREAIRQIYPGQMNRSSGNSVLFATDRLIGLYEKNSENEKAISLLQSLLDAMSKEPSRPNDFRLNEEKLKLSSLYLKASLGPSAAGRVMEYQNKSTELFNSVLGDYQSSAQTSSTIRTQALLRRRISELRQANMNAAAAELEKFLGVPDNQ